MLKLLGECGLLVNDVKTDETREFSSHCIFDIFYLVAWWILVEHWADPRCWNTTGF